MISLQIPFLTLLRASKIPNLEPHIYFHQIHSSIPRIYFYKLISNTVTYLVFSPKTFKQQSNHKDILERHVGHSITQLKLCGLTYQNHETHKGEYSGLTKQ